MTKPVTLSRRQKTVLWALEGGWVAELVRPRKPSHKPAYLMRAPGASEASGKLVRGTTVQSLLDAGLAVRAYFPHLKTVWVFSKARYESNAAALEMLQQENPPATTNHPPPRFKTQYAKVRLTPAPRTPQSPTVPGAADDDR